MFLIQILLPAKIDGAAVEQRLFSETRRELIDRFGGLTAYLRSPASGAWTAPDGEVERDEMVMVEVLVPDFDRAWWREYARVLEGRFSQDVIHVRAIAIDTP